MEGERRGGGVLGGRRGVRREGGRVDVEEADFLLD